MFISDVTAVTFSLPLWKSRNSPLIIFIAEKSKDLRTEQRKTGSIPVQKHKTFFFLRSACFTQCSIVQELCSDLLCAYHFEEMLFWNLIHSNLLIQLLWRNALFYSWFLLKFTPTENAQLHKDPSQRGGKRTPQCKQNSCPLTLMFSLCKSNKKNETEFHSVLCLKCVR